MNDRLHRNIRLDFIFRFFCNFCIADGIFVLFLVKKGLSLWQIGILEGIFHAASIITEIPSGALADLLGRKKVLIASRISGIVSSLLMVFTDSMWLLGICFVFSAWTFNLVSGSEEALLYDSFLGMGQEERFFKTNSRLNFVTELSQGLALLAGGYLAEISYTLCYGMIIGTDTLALLTCLFMEEPENLNKCVSVKKHFITSYDLIKGNKKLQFVLFHYAVLFAFHTSVFLYSQEYYHSRGLSEGRIGLILFALCGCNSIGALLSEKISKVLGKRASVITGAISAAGLILMWHSYVPLSVLGFGINSMANATLYPLQSNELNKMIPSEQRATIISVSSMCFSVIMIILFPLMGYLADDMGMAKVILGVGVILLLYCVFQTMIIKQKDNTKQ